MAKSVSLKTGRTFKTVTAAKDHFAALLKGGVLKEPYLGADLDDIRAAYEAYCAKTNWALPSPPVSFYPSQGSGPGYTTRCFGVSFADGTNATFSMDKALRVK
ncbi:hypothetical protein D3C73_1047280 [compost metagenome]